MGTELLSGHWQVVQQEAAEHGHTVGRDKWRLMGPMHIADTYEQAKENCRYGLQWVFNYLSHIIPIGTEPLPADYDDLVDLLNESGRGVVGTPEMAIAQIERLQEKSGGFGCYLFLGADFADWRATRRNYELFAEAVMPHFTGQLEPVQTSYDLIMSGGSTYVDATLNAQFASIAQYQEERAAKDEPAS